MDKHSLPPDSRHYMINYIFRVQQKFFKTSSDMKKPVERAPATLLDSGRLVQIACHLSVFPV